MGTFMPVTKGATTLNKQMFPYFTMFSTAISNRDLLTRQILDVTKLKAFADDKLKVAKMLISLHDRI